MPKSPLASNIGALLTAWFGSAVAVTITLVAAFIITSGGGDIVAILPMGLLAFMIASLGALPIVLLLVLVLLLLRRFLPGLATHSLAPTLILSLVGAAAGAGMVLVYIEMFVNAAEVGEGVISIPVLAGTVGGVVLGALMTRRRLRMM
jgi:hypothetical protein